jgi:hypothetical protein
MGSSRVNKIRRLSMATLECSSKGDKRFSAFYAKVFAFGKWDSIENHYQLCKRFGDFVPQTWRDAKGKKPTHININGKDYDVKYLSMFYKLLWISYLDNNKELVEYAKQFDNFHDMFKGKNTVNCQADVIRQYIKEGRISVMKDCQELIDAIK